MNKSVKYSRKEKLKKIIVIGREVLLPFEEEGIIVDYLNLIWGFPYIVEITNGGVFNDIGEVREFKREEIIFKNKKLEKMI